MDTALDVDDVDVALAAAKEQVARLEKLKAARERARSAGGSGAGAPPKSSSWATLAAWRDRRIGGSSCLFIRRACLIRA